MPPIGTTTTGLPMHFFSKETWNTGWTEAKSKGIDKNVIYEYYGEHVQVLLEHTVHQVHEGCWGIGKTKGHDKEFYVAIPRSES
ncbi:hypothetical protein CQW23_16672 [Capsicum baccatum]|uniref:Uncharacterized protein n=1 Tax=Capsicum baccatum TaxID=33114 RepID=A0A2G2WBP0_CAPBA|nr:hypothetical protein CQW23_16672 [Capsicum baccatum]